MDDRIEWEARPALALERDVVGCVLANELVDAFPAHLVTTRDGRLEERFVSLDADDDLVFVYANLVLERRRDFDRWC